MQVRITRSARDDLEAIGGFIAEDNPLRADSFVTELLERCGSLAIRPERYPVATHWRGRELRRCPFGKYLILYSIRDEELEINHIVHSARDYMRLLFPED